MADEARLRKCVVWLAAVMVGIGLYTHSLKKIVATYVLGMLAIGGVLLPDWEFFDRPVSHWTSPITLSQLPPLHSSHQSTPNPSRFRFYPLRTLIYIMVYGYGLYKWWMYIST